MQSALAVANATSPVLQPDYLPAAARSIALSDLKSDRMAEIMRLVSLSDLRSKMRNRASSDDLRAADLDTQIQGLSEFSEVYLPLDETVTFVAQVLAKVRQVYRAKNFGSEEFRMYFHAMSKVMRDDRFRDDRLPPVPSCVKAISETGFWLTGVGLRLILTRDLHRILTLYSINIWGVIRGLRYVRPPFLSAGLNCF
jgi:hypothetical protein